MGGEENNSVIIRTTSLGPVSLLLFVLPLYSFVLLFLPLSFLITSKGSDRPRVEGREAGGREEMKVIQV